ncbi:sigma-54 interaction domain-containing protein [Evansella clarkii]|jgi:transcriptional regulator with PAS, ATPase and Fis domain|uniref:sigma-54 interaction domain-containing protein n=1 Tax=Evansella clarkii TaxID=79879 RepID=UPI000997E155|nr:sigma 54-interacting transcriptional regulator [Evansella clarkii]
MKLKEYKAEIFDAVMENMYYCFVAVDKDGFITFLNDNYCRFINTTKEEAVGKHVTEVIENTRMHIVAQTGKEEIAELQYIRGNYMIANRIPVFSDGKLIGAAGMVVFRDTEEWQKMNSHIKSLLSELEFYRNQAQQQHGAKYTLNDIVGSSVKITELKRKIKKVAGSDVSVLIRGESGTGKELVAHSLHHLSERNSKPFVKVNCAAIPEHLIESELFGYEEGAFTGARKGGKKGKFQLADGGTIFLDEIGDMPLGAQVKILRAIQEREVEAVGAVKPDEIDVRIIAATNQPLEKLVEENKFREDLFYRINVVKLEIPPLKERKQDIRLLAKYILHTVTLRLGKRVIDFENEVTDRLLKYTWPGNIRELENVIESAVHLTNTENIKLEDLPQLLQDEEEHYEGSSLKEIIERTEKKAIKDALRKSDGNKLEAAKMLGLGKTSFYDKLKKYGF